MRRLALVAAVGLVLAACGSSGMSTTTPPETGPSSAFTKQEITTAYENFFSSKTSLSGKVRLLQNGSTFKPLIQAFASNPLAKNVNVKVTSVKLQGQDKAKVVYVVKLGSVGLPKQTGTAVRQNGTWKVGDASLCKLVGLQGSTPSVCKS